MCLAVPGQILSIEGDTPLTQKGVVDFGGISREVNLAYVPKVEVGDYVVVHVGFALAIIDEEEAHRVFEYIDSLEQGRPLPLSESHSHRGEEEPAREKTHEVRR